MRIQGNVKAKSLRDMLLTGAFIRILFIEILLLVFSLVYRLITQDATALDLFWYSIRITVLVIIVFMVVSFTKNVPQSDDITMLSVKWEGAQT